MGLSVQSTHPPSSGPPICVRRVCQQSWDTGALALLKLLRLRHVWNGDLALSTQQNWEGKPSEGS